jgi:hypothetical protein
MDHASEVVDDSGVLVVEEYLIKLVLRRYYKIGSKVPINRELRRTVGRRAHLSAFCHDINITKPDLGIVVKKTLFASDI